MSLIIRPVGVFDLSACHAHLYRHSLENGTSGNLIHAPFAGPREGTLEEFSKGLTQSLQKTPAEVSWERQWGLFDGSEIRGTIQLRHSPRVEASLHRALMAMGIERDFRGQGWGGKLLQAALDWARSEPTLAWGGARIFFVSTA